MLPASSAMTARLPGKADAGGHVRFGSNGNGRITARYGQWYSQMPAFDPNEGAMAGADTLDSLRAPALMHD
jgi:hypothetical protein